MKRTFFILLGLTTLLVMPRPSAAAHPLIVSVEEAGQRRSLTVEECIEMSLKASKGLHASEMRVEASAAKTKEMGAARLPALKLGAGYTRLSQVPPFEVSLPFLPTKFVVSPNYFNNYVIRLGLQQPLFTGFRLEASTDMARLNMKAYEQDMARNQSELVYEVRAAYWNLYKAREFTRVVDESLDQIRAHLADVKNKFDAGLLTRNEVLRAEVQLSNVQLARIDAGNAIELAGVWLNSLLGLPLDTGIDLATGIEAGSALSGQAGEEVAPGARAEPVRIPESLVAGARDLRPDLKAMEFRVKAGEAGVTAAKSGYYPQVFLSGNYYDMRPNSRLLPAKDKFYSTWDISLNISMDLWNWGTTARQTQQAKAQLAQAADALGQLQDVVAVEVRQCWLDLRKAKEKIAVGRASVAQAEENFRVTTEQFQAGVAINADVLDAEVALLQARTNLTQSLVDMELAKAKLEKATGK